MKHSRVTSRLATLSGLLAHFARREKLFLAPILVILLLATVLLLATGGLSYVAPFVYAIF